MLLVGGIRRLEIDDSSLAVEVRDEIDHADERQVQARDAQLDGRFPGVLVREELGEQQGVEVPTVRGARQDLVDALEGFELSARLEGIIPALETAHAILPAVRIARESTRDDAIIVNLSGRGDKDVQLIADLQR